MVANLKMAFAQSDQNLPRAHFGKPKIEQRVPDLIRRLILLKDFMEYCWSIDSGDGKTDFENLIIVLFENNLPCFDRPLMLLTQLWSITMLSSLIARQWVGPQTKLRLPDYQCLCSDSPWSCLWFSCLLVSSPLKPFLCFISVFDYMCFIVMFYTWDREPICRPSIYLRLGAASELRLRFRVSKTGLWLQ